MFQFGFALHFFRVQPGSGLLAVTDIPRWGTSLLSMLMDLVPWILREARDQFDNAVARATCCVTRDLLRGFQTLLPFTQRGKMPAQDSAT